MPTSSKPIVIAHRGASGYLPEHTLEAKALAYAMGADFLEQDLVLSKDGELIVLHDIHLETVTNVAELFPKQHREDGHFYAIDFVWPELQRLSVHERIDRNTGKAVYPDRYPLGKGSFRLHRLEEELALIQGLNQSTGKEVGIYPEIKKPAFHHREGKDLAMETLKLLSEFGYEEPSDICFLQCFDPVELTRIRDDLSSRLPLIQLIGKNDWNEADTDYREMVTPSGLDHIAGYANGIGPSLDYLHDKPGKKESSQPSTLVQLAHQRELLVHPFTLRKETIPQGTDLFQFTLLLLQKTGIDGFFTDFPDIGRSAVDSLAH